MDTNPIVDSIDDRQMKSVFMYLSDAPSPDLALALAAGAPKRSIVKKKKTTTTGRIQKHSYRASLSS